MKVTVEPTGTNSPKLRISSSMWSSDHEDTTMCRGCMHSRTRPADNTLSGTWLRPVCVKSILCGPVLKPCLVMHLGVGLVQGAA